MNIYINYKQWEPSEIISETDWNNLEADWMREDYSKLEVSDVQGKQWLENYDTFWKIQKEIEHLLL